jgi:hypothetical protein
VRDGSRSPFWQSGLSRAELFIFAWLENHGVLHVIQSPKAGALQNTSIAYSSALRLIDL